MKPLMMANGNRENQGAAVRHKDGLHPMLRIEAVTVAFDGYRALDDLNLAIDPGTLHCIIGPNGAGKSTLMDVITGRVRPVTGRVLLDGHFECTRHEPWQIAAAGVGRKFQRPTVFEKLTVAENLTLAMRRDKGLLASLVGKGRGWASGGRDARGKDARTMEDLLRRIGLHQERHRLAGWLSHGQKQWLELGMLVAQQPKLLLVDEPVAGMTPGEVARTAELLSGLAGSHTIVVVEHDMAFVRSIATLVSVLHQGRLLAQGSMAELQANAEVRAVYLGEEEGS